MIPRSHRALLAALVIAGWLIGAAGLFAVLILNEARDRQLRDIQAQEAWARYDGQITSCARGNVIRVLLNTHTDSALPIVRCYEVTPRPTLPRPKE